MVQGSRWVAFHKHRPGAGQRLFCFPHAGGGATAYYRWLSMLPSGVELCAVQLPGREQRLGEAPINDMTLLVERLMEGLAPWLDGAYSFFGHSMGSAVAFELTHALIRAGLPGPQQLLVSGRRAPHCASDRDPIHGLPDQAFLAKLGEFAGTPREVLENAELMGLLLPMLRADFRLIETYQRSSGEVLLDCPLTVFGGLDDHRASRDELLAWRESTRGPFRLLMLPGEHFFLHEHPEAFMTELSLVLGETVSV